MRFKFPAMPLAVVALLAASPFARAADIPAPIYKGAQAMAPYHNWTGFFIGINAGYGFGSSTWDAPAITNHPSGLMAGGTLGYNYQIGSVVFGFEGDLDWAMVKGDTACPPGGVCETKNYWLTTVRNRVGYAMDRFMPFVTFGGAYGGLKASNTGLTPSLTGATATGFGWTAGAGVEYVLAGNWSAKIDYLYVDLGKFDCLACAGVAGNDISFRQSIVRAGLNYKFTGPRL